MPWRVCRKLFGIVKNGIREWAPRHIRGRSGSKLYRSEQAQQRNEGWDQLLPSFPWCSKDRNHNGNQLRIPLSEDGWWKDLFRRYLQNHYNWLNEYYDYNIVMSLPNGRPMEGQVISRSFKRLIRKNNLPDVVFHSLRHSSTTYKLKLNGGDMKSMQGDTGHAQLKMVSDVYSHILDEDRRHNAEMFEDAFYKKTPTAQKKKTSTSTDAQQVMELLNASPDLASQLLKMLQIVNGGTQNAVWIR